MRKKNEMEKVPKFPEMHGGEEDFGFMLWKSELNKELLAFWKSLNEI